MTVEEKILKAKLWLGKVTNFPFFSFLLSQLRLVEDKNCPTMGVDGENLYINSNWVDKLSDIEIRSVLLHESLHLGLSHLWRGGARDKFLWNIATDFCTNLLIKKYTKNINPNPCQNPIWNLQLPCETLLDNKYQEMSAEEIYKDIEKNAIKIKINIGGDFSKDEKGNSVRGSHGEWEQQSVKKQKQLQQKWNRIVKQAAEMYKKSIGNLPAELQRIVELTKPKVDWRNVLLSYVVPCADDYTFQRPDRRFLSQDFIMPSMSEGEKLEEIVICLDASGSIDKNELGQFVSEVTSLINSFNKITAYCCSFDTSIYGWSEINNYEIKISTMGGGGTSTVGIFEEIKKRKINPSVVLIFTDLFAEFPPKEPDYPVLWLTTKNRGNGPGWGRIIECHF